MGIALIGLLGTVIGAMVAVVLHEVQSRRSEAIARQGELRVQLLDWISTQRHIAANLIDSPAERLRMEAEMVLAATRLLGASQRTTEQMAEFQRFLTEVLARGGASSSGEAQFESAERLSRIVASMRYDVEVIRGSREFLRPDLSGRARWMSFVLTKIRKVGDLIYGEDVPSKVKPPPVEDN